MSEPEIPPKRMTLREYEVCRKILDRIESIPVHRLFWEGAAKNAPTTAEIPLSISLINDKLDNGLYPTLDSFITDFRTFFEKYEKKSKKKSIRTSAIWHLHREFDIAVNEYKYDNSCQFALLNLDKSLEKLSKGFYDGSYKINEDPGECGANIFKKDHNNDVQFLLYLTKYMTFPEIVIQMAAVASSFQPESVSINENLFLDFSLLNEDTCEKLINWGLMKLKYYASGRADPYPNSRFGIGIRPIYPEEDYNALDELKTNHFNERPMRQMWKEIQSEEFGKTTSEDITEEYTEETHSEDEE